MTDTHTNEIDPHAEDDHHHETGHAHGISADADRRYLMLALVLLSGFMIG